MGVSPETERAVVGSHLFRAVYRVKAKPSQAESWHQMIIGGKKVNNKIKETWYLPFFQK